jgi:hypothetical protein
MAEMDSGTAYNDMLERVNKMSNEMARLADRIKMLEDRANREDLAKTMAQLPRDGK